VKLNHIDVVKLRLDIVALPDKYVEEVMATYATYEAVQKIDAVSLWERMPMKQVPGHTIMQCKATVREIEDEPNAIHFELLDAAMDCMREQLGHFGMYRAMPWAWRNIEYRRQALFEGVEHRTDRGPMGNSPELREALMDRIALNIVVEHL
jgi:hypothetical protein